MLWHESVGLLDALQTSQMIKLSRSASLGTLVETITTTPAITMQKKKSPASALCIKAWQLWFSGTEEGEWIFVSYDMQPCSLVQISVAQATK